MGLFDKKYCDICGEKIGLLGNRKLENGNLCKNCARKLSPWFSDRRGSTVEEIRAQLAYRAENQEKVAAFHTTRTLGADTKVLLDEDAGKFMVTRARNLAEANPDVLDFADVTGWGEISEEQVLERNPDYIVTISMYYGEGPTPEEEILSRTGWENVTAVKDGKILNLQNNELSRPGPRLADGAKAMYDFVYGE